MDNKNLEQLLKIKAMLAGSPQKLADGGAVNPRTAGALVPGELVPYMPTPAEEEASGLPPGPQRAVYIASRKKQAADAANGAQGYDGGGEVQPKPNPSPSSGPYLDPNKTKQFQKGFNDGDITLSQALANAKKSLGFADGGAVPSLSNLSDDELKALLSKTSDSVDDDKSTDALVNAPANTDDGFDSLRAKLNALSDQATQSGQMASDEASGKDSLVGDASKIPLPNGGLSGDALASYIAKNPGPVATTGFNPANPGTDVAERELAAKDDSDDEDEDDEDDSPAAKASSPAAKAPQQPQAQQQSSPQAAQDPNDPFNLAALRAAQAQQNTLTGLSGIGRGLGTIGAAISRGNYKNDTGFFDDFNKNIAAKPVNNLLQQQQVSEAGTEHALKQYALADEKERNDPTKPVSQLAQTLLSSQMKQLGYPVPPGIQNMSASSIEKAFPTIGKMLDNQENAKARAQYNKERLDMMQATLGNKLDRQDQGQISSAQKQLITNKSYQSANDALTAATDAQNMADEARKTGAAAQVMPVLVARLMTHGQRINQPEIHAATGSPDLASWSQRITNKALKGTLDNTDYQQVQNVINVIKNGALQTKSQMENDAADRFSQSTKGRYDKSSAYKALTGRDYVAPQTQQTGASRNPQSSGGSYSDAQELGIKAVMEHNGVDRDTAVAALKKAGKL